MNSYVPADNSQAGLALAPPVAIDVPFMTAPRLILASASPRRRELLSTLNIPFGVEVATVTEHEDASTDPRVMVAHNAALKADWVAERHPDAYVLGADTTVFIAGHALNKPRDLTEARAMLHRLSGQTHTVFTGLALRCRNSGIQEDEGVASAVTFKSLDDTIISQYLEKVHVLDKAGAYAIQEHADLIIAGFTGSWTNIVGLPLETTKQILTRHGLLGFTSSVQPRTT